MVASDTIVGIVGAVVLVAVMAGVFVYEYNNPAEDGGAGASDAEHAFLDSYPDLDASDDLDQDGMANLADDDMDGDGTHNANDTDVAVLTALTGQRPQLAPGGTDAGQSFPVYVGSGAVHLEGGITYSTTTPSPVPADHVLSADLRDADGQTVASSTVTRSGMTATLSFETTELPAGNYTLVVRQTQAGQATNFAGSLFVHYPAAMVVDHEHM